MDTRKCKTCSKTKPLSEYYKRSSRGRKGHQVECCECAAKRAREYRQSMRDYVGKIKMESGCEICGFEAEHPCQLDLDHINPEEKTYKGSHKSYDAGWSKKRIDAELEKCQIICKNCHALRTYKEGHWKNVHTDISMRQSSAQ